MAAGFYGRGRSAGRSVDQQMDLSSVISSMTNLDDFELSGEESGGSIMGDNLSPETSVDNFGYPSQQHSNMYSFEATSEQPIHAAAASPGLGHSATPAQNGHHSTPTSDSISFTPDSGYSGARYSTTTSNGSTPHQAFMAIRRREDSFKIADLLERQNLLITDLLKKQETLSSSIQEVQSDLKDTKTTVTKLTENSERRNDKPEKMKRKYPSSLTERLAKIYDARDEKLDLTLSSSDVHNKEVKEELIQEVKGAFGSIYADSQIRLAVQRLYEGRRRQILNAREENVQRAEIADKKKKYRARRERSFARRSKYVPSKLREKWDSRSLYYMSEEEDADGDKILVKKLPWRSHKLNELMCKLDSLASEAAKAQKNFVPERKERVISAVSSTERPPAGAPDWALKPEFRKGPNQAETENVIS